VTDIVERLRDHADRLHRGGILNGGSATVLRHLLNEEIGRASCRERV